MISEQTLNKQSARQVNYYEKLFRYWLAVHIALPVTGLLACQPAVVVVFPSIRQLQRARRFQFVARQAANQPASAIM